MPGLDEQDPSANQIVEAQAVFYSALRFLRPLRENLREQPSDERPIPLTLRHLGTSLADIIRIRQSHNLPPEAFPMELWDYVTALLDEVNNRPESLDYRTLAQYIPHVFQAIKTACAVSNISLPDDVTFDARKPGRSMVTNQIASRPRRTDR
ncbi:hypothetical protein [Actinocorallia aurantiaca]|uniref:Uncharacterized protein n=1 Tax=Actinocorallia aurantiaca TaxID=46204 RepID=A0ABP6GUJ6_9ACTN